MEIQMNSMTSGVALCCIVLCVGPVAAQDTVPLKEAKLNIEHNATDSDTGFQGFIDSEGWSDITVTGPGGEVLHFEGRGMLAELGLTELFFETVEPENADVPIDEMLSKLPEGEYVFEGTVIENGEGGMATRAVATLTHAIPEGPELIAPAEDAAIPADDLTVRWGPVQQSITGQPVEIVAYQLIIERIQDPHPNFIGKYGLSVYLPPSTTELEIPDGFLEPGTEYSWEVLAIEASGNQTLSSSSFRTE
jgi:hypothetical protein